MLPSGEQGREILVADPAWSRGLPRPILLFFLVLAVGGTLVGAFALVYGLFFWPSTALLPAVAPIAVGVFVLGTTLGGILFFRRTLGRRADSLRIDPAGVRAVLRSGASLRLAWDDPGFSVDVRTFAAQEGDRAVRRFLRWNTPPTTYGQVSDDGAGLLVETARRHALSVSEQDHGPGALVTTTIKIRGRGARR